MSTSTTFEKFNDRRGRRTENGASSNRIHVQDIERLLAVAARLFAEHGFDGVGMRKIAEESGIHLSSIQYHFESKSALFEEVLDHKYDAFYDAISQKVKYAASSRERFECAIGALFDALMQDEFFLMLLHRDIVDMIADRDRSAFYQGYSRYCALTKGLLEDILKRSIDDSVMFALISVMLGYTELAMALRRKDASATDEAWVAQRRGEMIELVNRICMP